MKRLKIIVLVLFIAAGWGVSANGQLIQKAGELLQSAVGDKPEDTTTVEPLSPEERMKADSVRLQELMLQVQEMKLNEIMLRSELDNVRSESITADSVRLARQRQSIDSLRAITPGVPVAIEGDTLFMLYAERGGYSALARAEMLAENLKKIGNSRAIRQDTIHILENEYYSDIMYGSRVLMSVTDLDALWQGVSRSELAKEYSDILAYKIAEMREHHSFKEILKRAALFLLVIIIQYLLFKLTNYLFRRLRRHIIRFKQQKLKPVIIRDYELLNKRRLGRILLFLNNVLRWIVLIIQLTFSVPIMFAIFPQTEKLAMRIFMYILDPVKMVLKSIGEYIPNLFIILVIWFCIRYLIKGVRYIANEIESEKLKITGFYPDWAHPTFNIIRFLLYAFMIAMIYPYLPGSDSGVFQGISVFVGLIVSLGSSTVIGNIIAGLVITYMRPFKIGDRIKLNDTTGNVVEKTPFVTRLRTPKNEVVTIPNSFIMSSHTVNYSASARQYGLIIHTTVTIGYDAPWRQVHQLLINAARMTHGVLQHPKPFVLETELSDYYPCYQLNAYIKDADKLGDIYSELHQHIQDVFNEAGVEIMSPHYFAQRDGNASTIPADYLKGK